MVILGSTFVILGVAELLSGRAWIVGYGEVFPKWKENKPIFFTSVLLKIVIGLHMIIFP